MDVNGGLTDLRGHLEAGPWDTRSRGPLRRLVRRAVLRATKPVRNHQAEVDHAEIDALEGLERRLDRQEEQLRLLSSQLGQAGVSERDFARLQRRVIELVAATQEVLAGQRARPHVWQMPIEVFNRTVAGEVYGFEAGAGRAARNGDGIYRSLEDVFRGPSELVAERQATYVALLADFEPVVDVGCGRGELLRQLSESGVACIGVEPDTAMRASAQAHDVDTVALDGNAYLESLDDDSVGAIFSAQVIEHMSSAYLFRFLELSIAKLRPGGAFVAETPNPHSAHSLKTFWTDVTHEHPVLPEVALALCWSVGYESAYVFHPAGSGDARQDRFVEPEYAVVAQKREAEGTA